MAVTSHHLAATTAQLIDSIRRGDPVNSWDALESIARKEACQMAQGRDHAWELIGKLDDWKSLAVHGAVRRLERWLTRPLTMGEKRRFAAEMYQTFKGLD